MPPKLPDAAALADKLGLSPSHFLARRLSGDVAPPRSRHRSSTAGRNGAARRGDDPISPTGAAWQPGTTVVTPRTHFVTAPSLFTAAPRPALPEISNGFLQVDDATRFRVIQSEVAGDAVKLRNAATHVLRFANAADRPGNMPGEGGLPALRTAGISLIRGDTATQLAGQFLRSCALNRFLAAQDQSPEPPAVARYRGATATLGRALRRGSGARLSHRRFRYEERDVAIALRKKRRISVSRSGRRAGRGDGC